MMTKFKVLTIFKTYSLHANLCDDIKKKKLKRKKRTQKMRKSQKCGQSSKLGLTADQSMAELTVRRGTLKGLSLHRVMWGFSSGH